MSGGNLSYSAHDFSSQTLLIRGSSWVFSECDIRCFKGVAVRVTNGYHEFASRDELAPFQLFSAVSDPLARVISSNVTLVLCRVGGLDPGLYACIYVCVYIHTYTHTYIHTYMHTYIHTYKNTHTYKHSCVCAHKPT